MMSCSLPLSNLWNDEETTGKTRQVFSTNVNIKESEKIIEISEKSSGIISEMRQFYQKLDAVVQQESEIPKFSTEKVEESKIRESTASANNARFFGNSEKSDQFAINEEKAKNAGRMINAAFYYAEQLRSEIEHGSRVEKDKRCNEHIQDSQTLEFEKLKVSDKKE